MYIESVIGKGDRGMKDRFGKEIREPREFNSEPEWKVDKKVTRLMTVLLFLIAAIIFFFPSGDNDKTADAPEQKAVSTVTDGGVMLSPTEDLPNGVSGSPDQAGQ
jgi:hypothetical protein